MFHNYFSRVQRVLVSLLASMALILLATQPASAATDVTPPAIVGSTVDVATVDVTTASAQVLLSLHLMDQTGVASMGLKIRHPETGQMSYLSLAKLTSGTAQDGIWQAVATIPQGSAPGTWVIEAFALRDTLANRSDGFIHVQSIEVTSDATDFSPPVVVSSATTVSTLDVSSTEAKVILSVRLTDETAVGGLNVKIRHPETGQMSYLSNMTLATGTAQNGVWRGTATVPRGSAAGTWVFEAFTIRDVLDNQTSGFIYIRSIAVKSSSTDWTPPAVVSSATTAWSVDVTNAEAKVILSVRLTDETAVAGLNLKVRHPESGQMSYLPIPSLASGTPQNGVWRATATFPKGAAAGTWVFEGFSLRDTVGNQTSGFIPIRSISVKSGS